MCSPSTPVGTIRPALVAAVLCSALDLTFVRVDRRSCADCAATPSRAVRTVTVAAGRDPAAWETITSSDAPGVAGPSTLPVGVTGSEVAKTGSAGAAGCAGTSAAAAGAGATDAAGSNPSGST